jgi:phosphate transport system permease protein
MSEAARGRERDRGAPGFDVRSPAVASRLRKRRRAERLFRGAGVGAIALALGALVALLVSVVSSGWPAFSEAVIALEVEFDAELIDPEGLGTREVLWDANYLKLVRNAVAAEFPQVAGRRNKRALRRLISSEAEFALRDAVVADPSLLGQTRELLLPLSDTAGMWAKDQIDLGLPEAERPLDDQQVAWLKTLKERGAIQLRFNWRFLSSGDSREPELAGVFGALIGSILTLLVTLACCLPVGVAAAVYLEEFAPRGRISDFIEININNLAAVPSVVFGLLGLAIFLNFFGMPRSAPLVGGLVLSLMTLPTVIIASRSALTAVPPSIREGAMAVGASPLQVVLHHVLPLATPGIMTGTIVGMARALGETAPLLMIGMVAFVADVPDSFTSASTVLPVQIYLWADSPERAFVEKTSAAIIVLLAFLVIMNAAAVLVRRKFERRW